MNKKIIVTLIAVLAVILIGIAGVFAYTKLTNNPKKIFLKGLENIISDAEELEPVPAKKVAEAQKNEAIETTLGFSYDPYSEESSEGTSKNHNSSLTLDMEEDEEEADNEDDSYYNDDEDSDDSYSSREDDEDSDDSYSSREDDEENEDDEEDADEFLSNYTWDDDEDSYGSRSALSSLSEMYPVEVELVATTDEKQKASNVKINVKTGEKTFLDGEINYKNDIIGARVEGAHEKFIALENKDLKKVAKNFDIDDKKIPDSIEILYITSDEITTFKTKSIEYWKNAIEGYDDSAFTMEDFTESFGDNFKESYSGKVTRLTLSSDTFKKSVDEYVNMVRTSDDILPSIKKTMSQSTEDIVDETVEEVTEANGNIVISIYESNNGIRKISFKEDNEDAKELAIILDAANRKAEFQVATKTTEDDGLILSPASKSVVSTEETDGKYVIKSKIEYDVEDLKKMAKNSDNNDVEEEDDDDDDYSYSSYSTKKDLNYYKDIYSDEEISYEVTYKENNDGLYSGKVKYNSSDKDSYSSLGIDEFEFDIKKSDGKALKDIDDENGIIINEYDDEDLKGLIEEIVTNIQEYAEENPNSWAGMIGMLLMSSLY